MNGFLRKELTVKLIEKGLNTDNYKTDYAFNDEQVINPEVIEKYGELSDDGYYELTKQGGGKLNWDDVYIYQTALIHRRNIIIRRNFVPAFTLSHVLDWLLTEKNIFIEITMSFNHFNYKILSSNKTDDNGEQKIIHDGVGGYDDINFCYIDALNTIIDNKLF